MMYGMKGWWSSNSFVMVMPSLWVTRLLSISSYSDLIRVYPSLCLRSKVFMKPLFIMAQVYRKFMFKS